ncbi:MAG: hypothetical protein K8S54_06555 [Spirochaetia bacterium]|nr:hypothetical protein [Spirochaetia bacterium]
MAAVSGTRITLSWIQETFWFIFLIVQLPFLFLSKWVAGGQRRERILILTDHACSPLFYFGLRTALRRRGFPVTVLGIGQFSSLTSQARNLARLLEELDIQKGIFIAHGKSGLAALALPDSARRRVQHLITLGTAFHGSRVFLPLAMVPAFGDMAVGSDFLLHHRMNTLLFPQFSPFCAYQDQLIYPGTLGHFGQGRDLILDRSGHWNLVLDAENIDTIVQHVLQSHPEPVQTPMIPTEAKTQAPAKKKVEPTKRSVKARAKSKPKKRR